MPEFSAPSGLTWGCIADDVTGATDLATNFVERGMRSIVFLGVPDHETLEAQAEVDVAIVALKSRTAAVDVAVGDSLSALERLRRAGASRFYFKYCSTFDSTPEGNIGPVIDALLAALGERLTVVVPSFPDGGRTVFMGHLFVGRELLSESPLRDHPLTPMCDANLLRLLAPQTLNEVDLIPLPIVRDGAEAVKRELDRIADAHPRVAVVVDATDRAELTTIMAATAHLSLITGGSGLAQGLPAAASARHLPVVRGRRAIICGSVSARTREQIAVARTTFPAVKLAPESLRDDAACEVERVAAWARGQWARDEAAVPLIYSADSLDDVDRSSRAEPLSAVVEQALGAISVALVAGGARQLIVAGGETSGRVLRKLGVTALRIGPEIAAGVAWSTGSTHDGVLIALALKSGNFGSPDMFLSAWRLLEAGPEVVL